VDAGTLDFNTILALAFGAWAGVVGWLGHGIRNDLRGIRSDLALESQKLNQYIVQTESRLAVLEDRVKSHD
jgi:hypothetical protein